MAGFINRERAMRRLAAIAPEAQTRVHDQLMQNGGELVVAQRAEAAKSKRTGELEGSIQYSDETDLTRIRVEVRAGGEATTKPVRQGQSPTYDYALADEFGTEKMAPQPFFFPPYRARRSRFKAALKKAGKEGIAVAISKP